MSEQPTRSFLNFIEHPLFLTAISLLAGLMGIFFFAPILAVCGIFLLLAIHRSKVIANWSVLPNQFCAYIVVGVVLITSLSMLNTAIQNKLGKTPKLPTAEEIATDVVKLQPPIVESGTKAPTPATRKATTLPAPPKIIEHPIISVSECRTDVDQSTLKTAFIFKFVNSSIFGANAHITTAPITSPELPFLEQVDPFEFDEFFAPNILHSIGTDKGMSFSPQDKDFWIQFLKNGKVGFKITLEYPDRDGKSRYTVVATTNKTTSGLCNIDTKMETLPR